MRLDVALQAAGVAPHPDDHVTDHAHGHETDDGLQPFLLSLVEHPVEVVIDGGGGVPLIGLRHLAFAVAAGGEVECRRPRCLRAGEQRTGNQAGADG